jgi:hypothetical protein
LLLAGACSSRVNDSSSGTYRNAFRALRDAPVAQTQHLAATLPDGRVILLGGFTSATPNVPDSTLTQIFDPDTEQFSPGPELLFSVEAQHFTSVAQAGAGGFLLVGGGINAGFGERTGVVTQVLASAAAGLTSAGDAVARGVSNRTATTLDDGGVLLNGGVGGAPILGDDVERYDPAGLSWRTAGHMLQRRAAHTATLLRDGRVLIVGGWTCCRPAPANSVFHASSAEIYDPTTGQFAATGSMTTGRAGHSAALLPDGRVLVAGGEGDDPDSPPLGTEMFDPATGRFSPAGNLSAARDSHSAVVLRDGRVLVVGGEAPSQRVGVPSTEIFDPASGRWSAGPMLTPAFYAATVMRLRNGKVLVFGGEDPGGSPHANAALFE